MSDNVETPIGQSEITPVEAPPTLLDGLEDVIDDKRWRALCESEAFRDVLANAGCFENVQKWQEALGLTALQEASSAYKGERSIETTSELAQAVARFGKRVESALELFKQKRKIDIRKKERKGDGRLFDYYVSKGD